MRAYTRMPARWCRVLRSDAACLGDGEHRIHIARVTLQRLHHLRGRVVVRDVQPQACPRARHPSELQQLRTSARSAAAPDHGARQLVGARPRRFHAALRQESASTRGPGSLPAGGARTRAARHKLSSSPVAASGAPRRSHLRHAFTKAPMGSPRTGQRRRPQA